MKTLRKIFLTLLVLNLVFIFIQSVWAQVPHMGKPVDDWGFNSVVKEQPDHTYTGILGILGIWLVIEFFWLLSFLGRAWEVAFVIFTIAILSSVCGPMIGSITDQGRMSAERAAEMAYSVGGAKDISNFRENVKRNFLPLVTDITCEGLFYDYAFDTGNATSNSPDFFGSRRLFYPSYSWAVSRNPATDQTEYFLSVGLNSDLKESDFARKKLNLVIVLDISGSMSSSFKKYYYGNAGFQRASGGKIDDWETGNRSKLEVACRSVNALLDHLTPEDRFGMVLFDHNAYLAKPLRQVGETDMTAIKRHVSEIQPGGSTNMEAGLEMGAGLLDRFSLFDKHEYENRVIFLTDAMPNTDDTSEEGLLAITRRNSRKGTYFSFIGIGVDFNTGLVEKITKIRGANYYSVHSAAEFQKRLDDEFEYMVTPLVFNLALKAEGEGFEIEKVYGSPEANQATGEIMKVNTLFPSKRVDGEARGGLVLLKVRRLTDQPTVRLRVSYEDRAGKAETQESVVSIPEGDHEFFQTTGIRKGLLLARYAETLREWLNVERGYFRMKGEGDHDESGRGYWERSSLPLRVSRTSQLMLRNFSRYFEQESAAISDGKLSQELQVLNKLCRLDPGSDS